MKEIIKKISVIGLCINLTINSVAYAGVLDSITEQPVVEESSENVKNTDEPSKASTTPSVEAETKHVIFSDISGHWAKNWIEKAVGLGFV